MIPLFKSHYSLGRSILTLEKSDSLLENGPDSIVDTAEKNELKEVFLVEDSMSGFLQAYKNLSEIETKLIFGLRINICANMQERSEDQLKKTSKYIIFCKNTEGYKRLIKISTVASRKGFYYQPRIDFKTLKEYWDDDLLCLVVPFYDSFLFNNTLLGAVCVPEFTFTKPTFFLEDNLIPFDPLMRDTVKKYVDLNKFKTQEAKSIFYLKEEDFKAYLTFRCINNRSTLDKPNLDHMSSNKFSFESWKEKCNA
jgi:DNA polymerase-3 subunit alpha